MALEPVAVPATVSAPDAPGVPSINRTPGTVVEQPVNSDSQNVSQNFPAGKWGLFDKDGQPVIIAETILDVQFKDESRLSNAPMEKGAFQTYNKTADPFSGRIKFATGGGEEDRNATLVAVKAAKNSLDLYSFAVPEMVYESVNITHYDFPRNSKSGVTLLTLEVWFEEVRLTGTAAYTKTTDPSGAKTENGGNPQPKTPKPAQKQTINSDAAMTGRDIAILPPGATT